MLNVVSASNGPRISNEVHGSPVIFLELSLKFMELLKKISEHLSKFLEVQEKLLKLHVKFLEFWTMFIGTLGDDPETVDEGYDTGTKGNDRLFVAKYQNYLQQFCFKYP